MINILLIGITLYIQVQNQNLVIDNQMQRLSLYKIKNEDQQLTIWVRFQIDLILEYDQLLQTPFALIHTETSQSQIIFMYQCYKQLQIIIKIPQLDYQGNSIQIANYNQQTWLSLELFKNNDFSQVYLNNKTLQLPQFYNNTHNYYGNFITWQNLTFSLKAYLGKQESVVFNRLYLEQDPFISINNQFIMNYNNQIQIEMFLRQQNENWNTILKIKDWEYLYQLIYGNSTVHLQIQTQYKNESKEFQNVPHNQWFKFILCLENNQKITYINTLYEEFEWIYRYPFTQSLVILQTLSRYAEIDNIVITNRLDNQNQINNCFPGCKKCIKLDCLECELNLNISNQCSCESNQFYNYSMQSCQDISKYEGIVQNEQEVEICELYEYFNCKEQKCMKCPRIDQYYCTDCVFNTELWKLNYTCTFQEIYTNSFLNYMALMYPKNKNTYILVFDQDYQYVINKNCEFLQEYGLIQCKHYEWETEIFKICDNGRHDRILQICHKKRGNQYKYKNSIMCKQGFTEINKKCQRCSLNCIICEYKKKTIKCLITKEGYYIMPFQNLIKKCIHDNQYCVNPSQIQQLNQNKENNCLLNFKQGCLYCDKTYVQNEYLECIPGEQMSDHQNFEFQTNQFNKLSQEQLLQIPPGIYDSNLVQQIVFYSRQYENIRPIQVVTNLNNNLEFCNNFLPFNKTLKCFQYKNNFTQIANNAIIHYCPNQRCTYKIILNIAVYISNVQIVMYKNTTYYNIQELLDNFKTSLYLTEIVLIAKVYVFDSFDQKCVNVEIFWLRDKFKNHVYHYTVFKLILIFQTLASYPSCQLDNFYSNFEYIEVRNLETKNQLLIQLDSSQVKFVNCRFFNNQEIFIMASQILFKNTTFLDFQVKTTLIEIFNNPYVVKIQFIQCNFQNISVGEEQILININSSVETLVIKNCNIHYLKISKSQFFSFKNIITLQIEFFNILELDSFVSIIFGCQQLYIFSYLHFFNIQIENSSFSQSVFYQINNEAQIKNLQVINCIFNQSLFLEINHRVDIKNTLLKAIQSVQSTLFSFREQQYFMKVKDLKIVDSQFNSILPIIQIVAYSINIEQLLISNCSYSPYTILLDIKGFDGIFQSLNLINITNYNTFQSVLQLPTYLINFDFKYIKIVKAIFQQIIINQVNLLYLQSMKASINDFILQNFNLLEGSTNAIIRISSLERESFLIIDNLQLINFLVNLIIQSQLIYIEGNKGLQQINHIIIRDIISTNKYYLFYCSRTFLYINHINVQFKQHVGFLNQLKSKIVITDYKQHEDSQFQFKSWQVPIFTNVNFNSKSEYLSISDSSLTNLRQPILLYKLGTLAFVTIKNVQIFNLQCTNNIFESQYVESDKKYQFFISLENILIQNMSTRKDFYFLYCQFCNIIVNQIYFQNPQLLILYHYQGISRINNIWIYNSKLQDFYHLFYFSVIDIIDIQNIYIRNQISNSIIFYISTYIKKITLKNIYIYQCQDCQHLIQIDLKFDTKSIFNIQDLFITSSEIKSELIKTESIYNQSITIRNLNIYNSKLYRLVHKQKQIIFNFNSICLINLIFDEEIFQDQIQFQSSYIQNTSYNGSQIASINQSIVQNQYKKLLLQPIYLSFKEQFIFNSTQIRENVYQVYFNKNQTFVYVPTGKPLSKFIYINPKTKQQENPYDNFIIILNSFKNQQISCSLNQSIDGIQGNFSNINEFNLKYGINIIDNFTFYMNPYLNYTYIQNDIICNNITLRFHIRTLPCQLGEYLYQNQCIVCDIKQNYYSVTRKTQICYLRNDQKIEKLKVGNIKILPGFWRAKEDSNQIEQCLNELCQGGWTQGDNSCVKGYVGSLCRECDIYNKRGQGRYAVQDDGCQICQVNYEIAIKGILISIWLVFLGYLSYNTNKQLTQQYLFFKISKRNVADILMRQSTNQISIIFKIFTNYIFFLYLLKDKLDFINYQVNISFAFISNPNSQLKPQLDCLLVEYHQLGIHYIQLIISIISPFYTLSFLYLIYLILLRFKVIKFQFNLVLITIYSVYLFNQQIIFQNQIQLLSYTTASNIQWINLNQQFQFDTKLHHHMMYYYILPSTLILILIPGVIFIILKTINKRSIKSTKYFGTLFTEYKSNSYYWEIVRIYQKYLIIGFLYVFKKNLIIYLVQFYLALMIFYQPYFLKNINYLEQKSFYILISSLINILLITDQSKQFRALLFSILNLILIYDVITNFVQKGLRQNRNLIIKIYQFLVKQMPIANRWIRIEKFNKLSHNMDILRNIYKKQKKIQLIHPNIQKAHPDFERLETEIEMIHIKK